ncbi:MAG: hypothetical protein OEM49_02010 [Myxococcales bacterium]|nr:hypothetical protein [Myxococcales bacterium]MDH5306411.1 hypothetical protein [Myxococcales bacterium]MDH5566354.1 hypothetical protein [Myxococcales bacterium]
MTALSKLICAMIGCLLIGFPGLLRAADRCILANESAFPGYVNELADGISRKIEYRYGQGDESTPEHAFVRGAIGARAADLFVTVQFDRSGRVTDFDVQRRSDRPVDEVLVHLLDACLDPYKEDLDALASHIEAQVKFQLAEEEGRKAQMER